MFASFSYLPYYHDRQDNATCKNICICLLTKNMHRYMIRSMEYVTTLNNELVAVFVIDSDEAVEDLKAFLNSLDEGEL